MQSPPFPRNLIPPRSKYSPQHHVLKHPQLPFLQQCQRPSFTPIQNNRQDYSSIYILIFNFLDSNLEYKRSKRHTAKYKIRDCPAWGDVTRWSCKISLNFSALHLSSVQKKNILTGPSRPNQPHIRPDTANVDNETFDGAVPVGGQGRVYFSASVARHPLPPPSRVPLSAMEALTSMPPACPPVWLQGEATPQSPAGHHSLQSNKTENGNERNL